MDLLLENGQLLWPYSLPWSPDGWAIPRGWTSDRTPEMTARFEELQAASPEAKPFLLWKAVEHEEGERRQLTRRPWLGWMMVPGPLSPKATKESKQISRAYRTLYSELNEEYSGFVDKGVKPPAGVALVQIPDGRYEFKKGRLAAR